MSSFLIMPLFLSDNENIKSSFEKKYIQFQNDERYKSVIFLKHKLKVFINN